MLCVCFFLLLSSTPQTANQRFTFFCSCKLFNYKREKWLRCGFLFMQIPFTGSKYSPRLKSQFSHLFSLAPDCAQISQFFGAPSRIENIPRNKLTHVFVLFRFKRNREAKRGDTRKSVIFAIFRCIKSAFLTEKQKLQWTREKETAYKGQLSHNKAFKKQFWIH